MTTSPTPTGRQRVPLDRIAIPGNVRELDLEHVDALAASIKLRGLLVPVIVRPVGDDFELVAGFHRFAAHKQLGEKHIEADVRDAHEEHADRAIENVARKQLNPHEPSAIASDATLSASTGCDAAWLWGEISSSESFECALGLSCREPTSVVVSGSDATLLQ
jgi:ParB/RepB/Spo0J family partition protein